MCTRHSVRLAGRELESRRASQNVSQDWILDGRVLARGEAESKLPARSASLAVEISKGEVRIPSNGMGTGYHLEALMHSV